MGWNADSKLPRSVWVLSWVSFFADVSSEMIYPLLPLFLVGVVGSSKTKLGAMEGIAVLLVAMLSAFAGIRSDRMKSGGGRTIWIRWGYGLPVVGKALISLATMWPLVLAGRMIDRFGKGLRGAPRDALISEAVSESMRGRAFGFHRAFDTAGALAGVLVSAFLLWWFTGTLEQDHSAQALSVARETPSWIYRAIFGIAAILGLVSWILTFFVKESSPDLSEGAPIALTQQPMLDQSLGELGDRRGLRNLPSSYWSTLAVLVLFSLANSSDTFLLLRTRDLGFSPLAVVLVYALYNITYSALSYPIGAISDKFGRWRMIAAGWIIYSGVYLCLAFLTSAQAWAAWPLMALYGVYMALTDGVGKALIADHSPRKARGAAMGVYYAMTGLTSLMASLLAGVAWDCYGPSIALLIGAGFSIAAIVGLLLFRRHLEPVELARVKF